MNAYEKTEKILNALANRSRLQILECMQKGISNPGEMATELKRHRSTIEKVPSLTRGGQLTIRYKIRDNANALLVSIREAIQKF